MEGLLRIESPYLIFAGDARDALAAKTGQGIVDWRPERCLGQLRLPNCRADHGLPDMTVAEAARRGAKTLVIGVVGPGGVLPEAWLPLLVEAVERGMDVASGLHTRLSEFEVLRDAAGRHGRRLIDVRSPTRGFPTGSGRQTVGQAAPDRRHGLRGRARSTRRWLSNGRCANVASMRTFGRPVRPAS